MGHQHRKPGHLHVPDETLRASTYDFMSSLPSLRERKSVHLLCRWTMFAEKSMAFTPSLPWRKTQDRFQTWKLGSVTRAHDISRHEPSLQSVGLAPYPHGPLQPSPVAFSIVAWRYPHTVALKLSAAKKLLLVLGRKTAQFEKSKHHLHQMWPSECDADLQPQPIARCAKIEPTT